jgi:hypothetical protein
MDKSMMGRRRGQLAQSNSGTSLSGCHLGASLAAVAMLESGKIAFVMQRDGRKPHVAFPVAKRLVAIFHVPTMLSADATCPTAAPTSETLRFLALGAGTLQACSFGVVVQWLPVQVTAA